jgi:alanyl-tRNA synthetase
MKPTMTSAEIRQSFLDFFAGKRHLIVPSASLVPIDDPTLLFTNAGMNPFKNVFLGLSAPQAPRVADAQKCMRVSGKHNDLEDVGPSPYHHTFFEMLGNWSFGDYYKKEAINWAWELLVDVWGFSGDRLYATVFKDDKGEIPTDSEAVAFWESETGILPSHILYFGRKDNFWEMADTGPCGPNSEIHYDRGPEFCDLQGVPHHKCQVNGDCHRFVELWNLVFIQYNSLGGGVLEALPAQHVDTGAGFERLVMVMQGAASNYDTDVFTPIFDCIQELAGHADSDAEANPIAYRVLADHSRASAFLIGDGVLPSNVGRGYVLRMIIRRAARFGRKLGFTQPFLAGVAEAVIATMGDHYRELRDRREHILKTITQEEERFSRTLDQGLAQLHKFLTDLPAGVTTLSGRDTFDLYATYGLPLEITRDVANEQGYAVDEEGFQKAMAAHRDLSGGSVFEGFGAELGFYAQLFDQLQDEGRLDVNGVDHNPYTTMEMKAPIVSLIREGERVNRAHKGDDVEVILRSTPFYVEAGGQVSDMGWIVSSAGSEEMDWQIRITDVHQPLPGFIVHVGTVIEGQPRQDQMGLARVDVHRRKDIRRNHTATHLLHRGLRQVLGDHVQQAGSLVAPDRLRFDFTHPAMLNDDELDRISRSVNEAILADYPVTTSHAPYEKALESGVIALFGEKYGDIVRVVRIGDRDAPISQELCGGTHVDETSDIGQFHILSEASVGAGLRRIEAVTGSAAQEWVADRVHLLDEAANYLACSPEEVDEKVASLLADVQAAHKEIDRLRQRLALRDFGRVMDQTSEVNGVNVLAAQVDVTEIDTLRQMTDWFRDRYSSGVVVLGAVIGDRPQLVAAVTPDIVDRGLRADVLIKDVARTVRGGGGGRPTLAQAGGRDAGRLGEALAEVVPLVKQRLGGGMESV